ncbi:voltage-dependent calcium channel subunit alpha-2/delta-3-like [Dermatophagoides farinae]|uniref:Voltage-dependent calcium channel subunit alpha-2/delta-3-like n=1 Tax=Dermatophagoides farinae TaxID=6954 RepID=A0A9D4P3Q0_DERFA|nr:voltage-dependent calcium channel subunit alpha-2/delta-3-like [Dermatophagoides farinae]XP_046911474.1 voltage-dependent calcium channel subunit alpha-2/delta-3-like [Dermatophagoides farinae]KAH7642485.1 voltage-dependent calcium channel subunit alpha-2/delta-3-like [Dermatophagoides farinae]
MRILQCQLRGNLLFLLFLSISVLIPIIRCYEKTIQDIAKKFGLQMLNIGYEKTCFSKISENFQKHRSEVKQIDASKLMNDMRQELINMFSLKQEAAERIAIETEKLAEKYAYHKNGDTVVNYYNVKRIYDDRYGEPNVPDLYNYQSLALSHHPNFEDSKVNLQHSAIHVPINVYEQASDIQNDIKWTETLAETFINNLAYDSSLSWQFFCSSKGFLREYPAFQWKLAGDSTTKTPDLYDCRMRQWYIQAAASPKDIVILLDTSGSMTGLRKNIAQNVVFNILDTLTEDDFVQVLKFTNEIKYVNKCFDRMVQATKRNIREIKNQLEGFKTSDIANFTLGFIEAFKVLNNFEKQKKGAQCNQAVMLITDGAPETYEHIFLKYNHNAKIRVFTYVIGREVTQIQEVYWMACNNRGFYAQVANLAEVREQVQQYIPVMSRPLVLSAQRFFTWTPVYAPVSEIQLTDWIWEERVKAVKMKFLKQMQQQPIPILEEEDDEEKKVNETYVTEVIVDEDLPLSAAAASHLQQTANSIMNNVDILRQRRSNIEHEMAKLPERKKKIPLRVTLSTPVFNHRKYINITRKILVKNVYKDSDPESIRIAQLHGVAGIDVPIREIEKAASSYQLGVNGYSFMLTNNGKVLYHPDFRPIFQDMLKPYYTSIDLNEVEISNETFKSRWVDPIINTVRNEMIDEKIGHQKIFIKTHLDFMKRPVFKLQHYFYGKIDNTPFSFAIVLPEPYGSYRFKGQVDLKSESKRENFTRFFEGNNWRIHPDWIYCESPHKLSGIVPRTPEDAILQFLNYDLATNSFVWKTSMPIPRRYDNVTCDKDLIQSLIFDAKMTHTFEECSKFSLQFNQQDQKTIDIASAFVSTRSGMTRFKTVDDNDIDNKTDNDLFSRSIDEVYYRRAVDFYYNDSKAFVYSIPFEAGYKEPNFLVTSSHAIFVGSGKMSAPVAVVGVQYNYSSFYSTFFKIADHYKLNCLSDEINCFVLDNNGFVIVSDIYQHAGLFLGEINDDLFENMVHEQIYRRTKLYDYQAICIRITPFWTSASNWLQTPWNHAKQIFSWLATNIITYLTLLFNNYSLALNDDMAMSMEETDYETDSFDIKFNKSNPKPCDKEFNLYELISFSNQTRKYSYTCEPGICTRTYYVQNIPHSNLILLVLLKTCHCFENSARFEPKECELTEDEACEMSRAEKFRKGPDVCHKEHEQEEEIKYCGKAIMLQQSFPLILLLVSALLYTHLIWQELLF